ncbi:MAG: tetratricopeptide repeat protein [Bryobacterales bacterium]|nr:tetratricopeptide repeat protein [Bryobacterales bacterium]
MAAAVIVALLLQAPDPMALAREAYDLARSGKAQEAEQKMRQAIGAAPNNALLHSALGGLLARMNRTAEARDEFAVAVKLAPDNPAVRMQLALRQRELGGLEQAWENARVLMKQQPADERVRELALQTALDVGASLARQNRHRAGLAVAVEAVKLFSDAAPVYEMLGLFQRNNQQNVDAVASYRKALELDPHAAGAAVGLGIAASVAGMPDEAVTAFESATAKFPSDTTAKLAYAVFLLRLAEAGDFSAKEKGRAMLEAVLKANDRSAEAHYQLGNLLLSEDKAQDALAHLRKAAELGLDDRRIHFALTRAHRRTGDRASAERHQELFRKRAGQ